MSLFNRNDKPGEGRPPSSQPQASEAPKPQPPQPQAQSIVSKPATQVPAPIVQPSPAKKGVHMASVISKALKITGQLESTEDIQIDGEIDGDVRGVGVKIGQNAKVKGTVYGDEVELAGAVEGKIESKKVTLTGTARMTGDITHQDIKIESGAYINGNLKPETTKSEARPALKPVTSAPSANASTASVSTISH